MNKSITLSKNRAVFEKSLSNLIDILDDIPEGGDNSTFTDSDGNEIRLSLDFKEDKGIVNIDIFKKNKETIHIIKTIPAKNLR